MQLFLLSRFVLFHFRFAMSDLDEETIRTRILANLTSSSEWSQGADAFKRFFEDPLTAVAGPAEPADAKLSAELEEQPGPAEADAGPADPADAWPSEPIHIGFHLVDELHFEKPKPAPVTAVAAELSVPETNVTGETQSTTAVAAKPKVKEHIFITPTPEVTTLSLDAKSDTREDDRSGVDNDEKSNGFHSDEENCGSAAARGRGRTRGGSDPHNDEDSSSTRSDEDSILMGASSPERRAASQSPERSRSNSSARTVVLAERAERSDGSSGKVTAVTRKGPQPPNYPPRAHLYERDELSKRRGNPRLDPENKLVLEHILVGGDCKPSQFAGRWKMQQTCT